MKDQGVKGKSNVMMISVVALGMLLMASLLVMLLYINKAGKLGDDNDNLSQELSAVNERFAALQAQNDHNIIRADSLINRIAAMESEHKDELEKKQRSIAYLTASGNKKVQELNKEIEKLEKTEFEYEKLQNRYDKLLAETLKKRDRINLLENEMSALKESIEQSRGLNAYNIVPITKWDRWICADRYNVDIARRVDQIFVTLEIDGSPFSKPGKRSIYLNLIDPEGNLMYPQGDGFPYTRMTEINYDGKYVPVEFIINNPSKLSPGEYTIQVYIDKELVRESRMTFN
jgi:Tfp pilus assembly protein PilN